MGKMYGTCKWCGRGFDYDHGYTATRVDGWFCSVKCVKEATEAEEELKSKKEQEWKLKLQREIEVSKKKREKEEKAFYNRECPMCAEIVKAKALVCKECGHEFEDGQERRTSILEWEQRAEKFDLYPWQKKQIEQAEYKISPEGIAEAKRKEEEKQKLVEEERILSDRVQSLKENIKSLEVKAKVHGIRLPKLVKPVTIEQIEQIEGELEKIIAADDQYNGEVSALVEEAIVEGQRLQAIKPSESVIEKTYGGFLGFGKKTLQYPMLTVPSGWFVMGALLDDNKAAKNEFPQHKVTVTKDFYIGKYPVTQDLWTYIMSRNPSKTKDMSHPVTFVSWKDCIEFCNKLSEEENLEPVYTINNDDIICNWEANGFRLPTEAEWEYAARAGAYTMYSGSEDIKSVAWFTKNSNKQTQVVGQKQPNNFGLYDMTGNVHEWCWDWYKGFKRQNQVDPKGSSKGKSKVARGGSFRNNPEDTRTSTRRGDQMNFRANTHGLRIVRNA